MLRGIVYCIAASTALSAVVARAQQPTVEQADHGAVPIRDKAASTPDTERADQDAPRVRVGYSTPDTRSASGQVVESGPVVVSGEISVSGRLVPSGPAMSGEYWLGVQCVPVAPALRTQLKLPEKQGLLVVEVVPKSPAAKAGISQYDILLRLGDRPLANPHNLVTAVEVIKDTEGRIELIRGGKRKTITATLSKRPTELRRNIPDVSAEDDWMIVQRWIDGMRTGQEGIAGQPPVRFRVFHHGAIVPKNVIVGTKKMSKMPENMSVIVKKDGDKPMTIVVHREDDQWEFTDKHPDMDKLPADIRPHVERIVESFGMTSRGDRQGAFDVVPDVAAPVGHGMGHGEVFIARAPRPDRPVAVPPMPGLDPRLERRFDEMNRRMDRMIELMEKMLGQEEPSEEDEK